MQTHITTKNRAKSNRLIDRDRCLKWPALELILDHLWSDFSSFFSSFFIILIFLSSFGWNDDLLNDVSFASLSYITLTLSLLKFPCLHVTVLLPVEQPAALSHIVVCANEIYGDKKQDQIEADEAWCLQRCGRMLKKCKIAAELHANMKTTWSQQSASVWQQSELRWSQLCCA